MKILAALVFGMAGAFACWTLWVWAGIALELTPATLGELRVAVGLSLAVFGGVTAWLSVGVLSRFVSLSQIVAGSGPGSPRAHAALSAGALWWAAVLFAFALAAWLLGAGQSVLWMLSISAILPLLRGFRAADFPVITDTDVAWEEWAGLAVLALAAWYSSALLPYANPDDVHFLDAAASFLVEPNLPLFATDTLFQVYDRPNYVYALNLGQSWDALAGYIAMLTRLNLSLVYYGVLPAVSALAVPAVWYLFGRLSGLRWALVGVFAALVLVYLSNELGGAMAGAFLHHRLFQGKAPLILAGLPLCFSAAMLYGRNLDAKSLALLTTVVVAVAGLSTTGLYMAPIAAGLGLLLGVPLRPASLLKGMAGIAVSAIPCIWAMIEFHVLRETGSQMEQYGYGTNRMLSTFGGGWTGRVHLGMYYLSALVMFIAGLRTGNAILSRVGLVTLVLGLCPWIPGMLGELSGIMNLYWRYYWLVPVGLILTGIFALLTDQLVGKLLPGGRVTPLPRVICLLIGVLVLSGLVGWSHPVLITDGVVRPVNFKKVSPGVESLVKRFARLRQRDGQTDLLVAAPPKIAARMNRLPQAPRQLFLRPYYFRLMPDFELGGQRTRIEETINLMRTKQLGSRKMRELLVNLNELDVTHVVLRRSQVSAARLRTIADRHSLQCERHWKYHVCEL